MQTMTDRLNSTVLNEYTPDPSTRPTMRDRVTLEALGRAVDALERIADALEGRNVR